LNARRQATAARWHAEARAIAREKWRGNPDLSARSMAPHVRRELAARDLFSADGAAPSVERVRAVIASENPCR
jgi:hypothetical protein